MIKFKISGRCGQQSYINGNIYENNDDKNEKRTKIQTEIKEKKTNKQRKVVLSV